MKRLLIAVLLFLSPAAGFAQDAAGCKDHPLFNRMPGYRLNDCRQSQFDETLMPVPDTAKANTLRMESIEGPTMTLNYYLTAGQTPAGALQIIRNYQNAIKKAGGVVVGDYPQWSEPTAYHGRTTILKLSKNNKEIWAHIEPHAEGSYYRVVIAEREAMQQDVVANDWFEKLGKVGFVAIYIQFDTGSAAIKPASNGELDQMAQMLKSNATLKVEVGGHTDNVGDAASNQKLSDARAKSVMDALVKRGIAAARLSARGYGPTVPIADNRLEEGRALNRRVELLKKS